MNIDVQPIQFSTAVRHMGPDDAMSSVAVSNVTRQLAGQDTDLAAKLNELIGALTNAPIPLPVVLPRTSIPALGAVQLGNFRIPPGFTATVMNATVSSAPVANQAVLHVVHSAGTFGQTGSGQGVTEVVTTQNEVNFNGYYVSEGEFIFSVTNATTRRLEVSASAIIVLKAIS